MSERFQLKKHNLFDNLYHNLYTMTPPLQLVVKGNKAGAEAHAKLGPDVGVQGVVVDQLEIVAAVTLLRLPLVQLEPHHVLVIIFTTASDHPVKNPKVNTFPKYSQSSLTLILPNDQIILTVT